MRTWFLFAAGACALMAQSALAQSGDTPLFRQNFDSDAGGWIALGERASVHQATAAGVPHSGAGALAFDYDIQPGRMSAAVAAAPEAIARMSRLRFWARSDRPTALGVVLAEKMPGGGRYMAWAWLSGIAWQQVEFAPRDFLPNDGPQDPADADGRLDLDAVENVSLLDIGQFFAVMGQNANLPLTVDVPTGRHTLLIDDFEVLGGAAADEGPGVIDRFRGDCLQWVTPGGIRLQRVAESPLRAAALEASYEQVEGKLQVMIRRLGGVNLAHAARLNFDIASLNETTLAVSLEMKKPGSQEGPRYNLTIFPPGNREVFHVSLKLADFEGPGKLDPGQLKSLSLADISGATGEAGGKNTIWISNVTLSPE